MAVYHNALLMKIGELSFAMDELRLFLDTHQKCRKLYLTSSLLQTQWVPIA